MTRLRPDFIADFGEARGGDKIMAASTKPTPNENLMAAASYLLGFVTGIIFLLIEKKSEYVRFHAAQSIVLFGGFFIVNIGLGFIPTLGWISGIFLSFVSFILWIVLMWKAFQGEKYKVPYVGDFTEEQLKKFSK